MRVFLRGGFSASSVQDITEEAGVPKGSFYNHFVSKEALAAVVVDLYGEGGTLRDALKDRSRPPLQRLRDHFAGLTKMFKQAEFSKGCLLGTFSAEVSGQYPEIRARLALLFERWSGEMEEAIVEAQQLGEIPTNYSGADLAAFLLDAYEGAILRSRVEKSPRAFERFEKLAFEKLLR
jgi:TetR/AcrR family transcriptional repressor of nem operon